MINYNKSASLKLMNTSLKRTIRKEAYTRKNTKLTTENKKFLKIIGLSK